MKRYTDLLAEALERVREIMPWDLRDQLARASPTASKQHRTATSRSCAEVLWTVEKRLVKKPQ